MSTRMFRVALLLVSCFLLLGVPVKSQYIVPNVLVEALSPKGFRVSIPDEDGVKLFAFHGKINQEIVNREAGTYSIDITSPKNGRWTFRDNVAVLKIGDKINYWVIVHHDDGNGVRGYPKDDQTFIVDEFVSIESGQPVSPPTVDRVTEATTKAPVCQPTVTKVNNGKRTCQGKLIFQDNFANLTKRWQPEIKFAGDPDYEFVIYQNNIENVFVQRNKLHIKPTLTEQKYGSGFVTDPSGLNLGDDCTGILQSLECHQKPKAWVVLPPVISAQLNTRDTFTFQYGVIEVRARLPRGDWLYPEIYLRSRNEDYGPGVESGLIKVAFAPGNAALSKYLYGGCVIGQSVAARSVGMKSVRSDTHWNDDYHTFKVEWKTDSITLSVDDKIYGNIFPPDGGIAAQQYELDLEEPTVERWKKGSILAPFDKEMYISIGVGAGGQNFLDRNDDLKPWRNDDPKAQLNFYKAQSVWSQTWPANYDLLVDYVKVWAL